MAKNPPENRAFKKPSTTPTLTQELIDKITNAVRGGNYIETSVALYGVPKWKFYEWLTAARTNEKPDSLERILADALDKAIAEAEVRDLQKIDMAAEGIEAEFLRDEDGKLIFSKKGDPIIKRPGMMPQWAAAAWKLERRSPRRWGRLDRIEQSGPEGGPIKIENMTEEELQKERARLQRILDDNSP